MLADYFSKGILNGVQSNLYKSDYIMVINPPDGEKLIGLIQGQREFRDVLLEDPYRPTYHFVNPEGRGMPFDPNGAIFWEGKYHLCYICL